MSRLYWCMVVVVALATFADAECMATQAFLQQALVEVPEAKEAETSQTKTDPIPEGPEKPTSLKDIDIKQLVAVDTTALVDVTNMTQSDAVDVITAAGLKVAEISYDYSDAVPAGSVMRQEPPAGMPVEANSEVKLVIAAGLSDLAKRVYDIEAKMLTKWDVAMVVSTMIAGIVFVVAVTVYIIRYCAKKTP